LAAEQNSDMEAVRKAISTMNEKLPKRHHLALSGRYGIGEVAQLLGRTEAATRVVQLDRAMKELEKPILS